MHARRLTWRLWLWLSLLMIEAGTLVRMLTGN